jgi:hypothetical protein
MLNLCLEMKVLKYGFVSLLLLASVLFIIHPTQNEVFGQGANTTNTTDTERPTADGLNSGFVPDTEDGAAPPPPPANAITVDKLPKETPVKDPDSDTLSITNRTEILQILPANSTKIIKHVDEDLKNTTGVGLAPSDVLEKITSEKSNDNKSILQLASPEDIKKIESEDSAVANATGGQEEEDEPVTNATSEEAQAGEQTNATATNATAVTGEQPAQTREEQKQAEGEEEQAKTGEEEQAQAGEEATNITNATSGEQPAQTREEQKQAEGEEEQAKTGEEQKQAEGEEEQVQGGGGDEAITNATNATAAQPLKELFNKANVTSMLNATDSEGENNNPEDDG